MQRWILKECIFPLFPFIPIALLIFNKCLIYHFLYIVKHVQVYLVFFVLCFIALHRYGIFTNWKFWGASLVVQWLRIYLPVQGTRVWALVRADPTCCGTAKPVRHNYWACALEPTSHNYWAHVPKLLKPVSLEPVLHPQQEKPPWWEARTPQRRVAPARRN